MYGVLFAWFADLLCSDSTTICTFFNILRYNRLADFIAPTCGLRLVTTLVTLGEIRGCEVRFHVKSRAEACIITETTKSAQFAK